MLKALSRSTSSCCSQGGHWHGSSSGPLVLHVHGCAHYNPFEPSDEGTRKAADPDSKTLNSTDQAVGSRPDLDAFINQPMFTHPNTYCVLIHRNRPSHHAISHRPNATGPELGLSFPCSERQQIACSRVLHERASPHHSNPFPSIHSCTPASLQTLNALVSGSLRALCLARHQQGQLSI